MEHNMAYKTICVHHQQLKKPFEMLLVLTNTQLVYSFRPIWCLTHGRQLPTMKTSKYIFLIPNKSRPHVKFTSKISFQIFFKMPLPQRENLNPLYAHLTSIMSLDPTTKIIGAYPNFLGANQCCVGISYIQMYLANMSRVYIFTLPYFEP